MKFPRLSFALLAALWLWPLCASAHNPDTSYSRVVIAADHIDLRFTFDIFTLQKIADLDADLDQRVTPAELQHAAPAIERYIRDHVRLALDDSPSPLGTAAPPEWPREAGGALEARDWHSNASLVSIVFHLPLARPAHTLDLAFDVFETLGARHTVLGAFEYAGRSEEVTFTEPEPDYLFDIAYADTATTADGVAHREPSLAASLGRFVRLGVAHIFLGYDHICFLLTLLVVSRFRELVKVVTSFTVAHSITLILAAMQIARLPSRFVECAVALTIVYVAAENFWRKSMPHRWMLTFAFGLIHGFSFAGVLSLLGLPAAGRVRCLLAFNAGVELGQLAVVIAAFPLLVLLRRAGHSQRAVAIVSLATGLFGAGWFIERAFGLNFMPI